MKDLPYITHQEASLSRILREYGNGFKPPEGQRIINIDVFVDQTKDTVIFKMLVDSKN